MPYGGKNFNSIISGNDERGLCIDIFIIYAYNMVESRNVLLHHL